MNDYGLDLFEDDPGEEIQLSFTTSITLGTVVEQIVAECSPEEVVEVMLWFLKDNDVRRIWNCWEVENEDLQRLRDDETEENE